MSEEENENGNMEDRPEVNEMEATEPVEEPGAIDETTARNETEILNQQISVLNDQLLRTLAEFDNYRKRTQREIGQITQNASEKLITELLTVIDDMERGIKAAKELQTEDARIQHFIQGFEIIFGKLLKILQGRGLKTMESVGKPMDPHLHDAMLQIIAPDQEPNMIVDEHEKGYFLNDKVIRHAKVIVSKLPDSQDP